MNLQMRKNVPGKRLKEIYESLSKDDIKDELSLKFKQTENNILKCRFNTIKKRG